MAIQRTHKKSDFEKRLKIIETQLYGKNTEVSKGAKVSNVSNGKINTAFDTTDTSKSFNTSQHSDVMYLKKDLIKIVVLSFIAIGVQLALHYSLNANLIKSFAFW